MLSFTRHNIVIDPLLPASPVVMARLIGILDAIDFRCVDGHLDYDFPEDYSPDWIISNDVERERIRRNFRGTWYREEEGKARRCDDSDDNCCNIEMAYHWNPALNNIAAFKNALWVRINEKSIYLYVSLGLQHIQLLCFSENQLYFGDHVVRFVTPPNFPTFVPPFLPVQELHRQEIGLFDNYNQLVNAALYELCYLCTK
jgi:hypothetical protein